MTMCSGFGIVKYSDYFWNLKMEICVNGTCHLEGSEYNMPVLTPKESGAFIAKLAKHVTIPENGIKKLAQEIAGRLKNKTLSVDGFSQHELHPQKADEAAVDFIFVTDTLNFCFWTPSGKNKWEVSWNGKKYTGYFSFVAALNRAIAGGIPITDPKFYSKITRKELEDILKSDTEVSCPLIEERLKCLHEVGKVLLEKFNGSFVNCVKESNQSSQKLLSLIVNNFQCFRDEADYGGQRVSFYKRAQILIGDIWSCFRGKDLGYFSDIETITMFADYRIPQVLIHFGAMEYSSELMKKLKEDTLLESGSPEEVEIRGCSIQAVELVTDEIKRMSESDEELKKLLCNSIIIDQFLWDYRRTYASELESIPYHKVLGIYY